MKQTAKLLSFGLLATSSLMAHAQVVARPDHLGDALQLIVPAAAAALSLYEGDTEGLKELGYSLVLTEGTTEVLKRSINSRRPDGSNYGFPSGHTAVAFASAAFVQQRYGVVKALPYYGLATLTAYSRVNTHHHFTRDVIGGALVGVGSALLLTHPLGPHSSASVGYGAGGASVQFAAQW